MTDSDTDSADDEKSLFARVLRRSADELEQDGDGDGDGADAETRADDYDDEDDEMDDAEQEASPIDSALEAGTIEAAQASTLRDVAEKMDDDGVQMLVDAISENDLDVDDAVEMIEAYNGGGGDMGGADDDGDEAPEELKSRSDGDDGADADGDAPDDELAELRSRLETLDALADVPDRLDELEARLDDVPTEDDVETEVEQRLEAVGEELDDQFEDLLQRAEVVGSPHPETGEAEGKTLGDVVKLGGD